MKRCYMGVDWGDQLHQIYAIDESGEKAMERKVEESVQAMADFGLWLDQKRAEGVELWAAIEKPEGRIVDFLLDHGVRVYPINPKALDRARDRFRQSRSKSDPFDAWVLAHFLRTDHGHLKALMPNSDKAQELKILTRDYQRLVRQKSRLLNQLTVTLKEYYPRAVDLFGDLSHQIAVDFLKQYPTPQALCELGRKRWERFARAHGLAKGRTEQLWERLKEPQLPVPEHVVRAKARLVAVLVEQIEPLVKSVDSYQKEVERFFASMPAAKLTGKLPGGKSGTTIPALWAELGDAKGCWESFKHLQAQAGTVPVTKRSGKSQIVEFRFSCNKHLRYQAYLLAFVSLRQSEWARAYYDKQRALGHSHNRALRALGTKWLKIIFVMWRDHLPYDENYHLANMARQHLRQAA